MLLATKADGKHMPVLYLPTAHPVEAAAAT